MPSGITGSRTGRPRVVWALAFAVVLGLSARVQARGDDAAEARKHAQRASNLAASGKCRQAVAEWNKAMAILRDPALLFNRGECYRKLGDTDAALEDYRQFLSDLPKAPNRGEVERRIAELTAQKNKDKESAPPPPPTPAPAVVATPTTRPLPAPELGAPPSLLPVPEAAPPVRQPALTAPPPAPSPAAEPQPQPALVAAPVESAAPAGNTEGGITTRPWFWITVAAVAVAAGVGTFVVLSRDSTNIPSTALGNYKF